MHLNQALPGANASWPRPQRRHSSTPRQATASAASLHGTGGSLTQRWADISSCGTARGNRPISGAAQPSCSGNNRSRAGIVVRSAATTATVELLGRQLTAEEAESWQASCDTLSGNLEFSAQECSQLLARAFGWTTQAFWRREKVDELPSAEQVADVLEFLTIDLALTPEEQLKVIKTFPEVLACDVEARLRTNAKQLQTQWRLQGSTLTKAVLRQPQVLGYSVDCGGDCVGECNRCWARF